MFFVGFGVLAALVVKNSIFWDTVICSQLKVNQGFGKKYRLQLHGRSINQTRNQGEAPLFATCFHSHFLLSNCSILNMEAVCYLETSVDFQWTTQRYILEDRTLEKCCQDENRHHLLFLKPECSVPCIHKPSSAPACTGYYFKASNSYKYCLKIQFMLRLHSKNQSVNAV
jgi:hypothetical protein